MASKSTVNYDSPVAHELRIVLLGNAGVGKSATANTILGREAFRETETTESEIQRGRVDGRTISVIDTPGINNRLLTEELKAQLKRCITLSAPGPHLFLLVVRMGRFSEKERNSVKWIQENFGEKALRFTMVLFIGKEEMTSRQCKTFFEDGKVQEFVGHCGGGHAVINSKREANPAQITKLLERVEATVQCNGGQYYTDEMYQEVQRKISLEEEKKRQETERKKREEEIMRQERERISRKEMRKKQTTEQGMNTDEGKRVERENREKVIYRVKVRSIPEKVITNKQYVVAIPPQGDRRSVHHQNMVEQRLTRRNVFDTGRTTTNTMDTVHPNMSNLRIVLLGIAGSGRTATGNTILGRKVFVDKHTSESLSSSCQTGHNTAEGLDIWVIDTPGINHTSLATDEWNAEIRKCLSPLASGPYVFLLVISLTARFRKEEVNTIKWIEENFGEEASLFTIILFTHIDQIGDRTMNEIFFDNPELRKLVSSYGSRYHTFNNKDPSRSQVRQLMEKIDGMIKANAGQHYTFIMYQEVQRMKQEQEKGRQGSFLSVIHNFFK